MALSREKSNQEGQIGSANPTGRFKVPSSYPTHPGGQDVLSSARAHPYRDILFLTSHISLDLDGHVTQSAKAKGITLPKRGPVYNEIHLAIRRIIQEHPEQVTVYRAWCLTLTLLFPLSMVQFTATASPCWAAALGFAMVSYSFNIFHIRHHRGSTVYGIDWLDRWTMPMYDLIDRTYAIRPEAWRHNHNESHHLATNDPTGDHDVWNAFHNAGMRLHHELPHYPIHKFQPIYIPALLSLNLLTLPFDNLYRHGGGPIYLATYLLTMFVLPTFLHGWQALHTMVVTLMGTSLLISYISQVPHNHSDVLSFRNTCANKRDSVVAASVRSIDTFLHLQMDETMSWGGYWSCLLFGGINYQIEHHIAPVVPSPLVYHYLSPYLRKLAHRQGWRYVYEPDLTSAVAAYHKHIYRMSLSPDSANKLHWRKKSV